MRAFRINNWKEGAAWVDVPKPEPGPGEVLIRIGGAGACHSDLHIMHEFSPETMPVIANWSVPMAAPFWNWLRWSRWPRLAGSSRISPNSHSTRWNRSTRK